MEALKPRQTTLGWLNPTCDRLDYFFPRTTSFYYSVSIRDSEDKFVGSDYWQDVYIVDKLSKMVDDVVKSKLEIDPKLAVRFHSYFTETSPTPFESYHPGITNNWVQTLPEDDPGLFLLEILTKDITVDPSDA